MPASRPCTGSAAAQVGGTVFTVDHHRGSEENQAGWEHHDPATVDPEFRLMDTLGMFRKNIARAGLEDQVIAIVGASATWRDGGGLRSACSSSTVGTV